MVSVIIPTYNRAELVFRAAKSVLNQTFRDFELIIVDDGSTDNTKNLVESLGDSRVRYIYQKNSGACAARNNGIDHAKGEYIAFHDSDDVWHEDKLEKQVKILKESGADLVFCCMSKIQNKKQAGLIGDVFPEGFCASSELPLGGSTQTLCADSDVFRTEHFDENMPRLQDFELLLRISKKYKVYYIKEPLVDYYMQEDSISMNPKKLLMAWEIILKKHDDFLSRYKGKLTRAALGILGEAWKTDDLELKKQLVSMALRLEKSPKVVVKSFLIHNEKLYQKIARIHKFYKDIKTDK